MNTKQIKRILRIFILFLFIIFIVIKVKKYKILHFESQFYNDLKIALSKDKNKVYNIDEEIKLINNFLNNKITVINVYGYDSIDFLKSLRLSKYILDNYENIGIFDIVVKDNSSMIDDIINLENDKVELLIKDYGIKHPILYVDEEELVEQLKLGDVKNKIILVDELGIVKYILDNDISFDGLKNKIEKISKQKKYFGIKNINNRVKEEVKIDSNFIESLVKIIVIEDKNNYTRLAILDNGSKRIIITTVDGEIIYDITGKNFCSLASIKYIDGKLYLADKCDGSIKYIDFEKHDIITFIKDNRMFGITDFEFLDDQNILFSTGTEDGIKIYNRLNGDVVSLGERFGLNYRIGRVNKIMKQGGKYYYLDSSYNILYSFDGFSNDLVVNLNDFDLSVYNEIKDFYINSDNSIYFLDTENNRILHKIGDKLVKDKILTSPQHPKNMLIFKNVIYVIEDNKIRTVNYYRDINKELNLKFSKNSRVFFNIDENLDIHSIKNINSVVIDDNKFSVDSVLENKAILPNSPSFLAIFEKKSNSEIILNKILFYNSLINGEFVEMNENKEYIIYGKIYYGEDKKIKIKNIDATLVKVKGGSEN